MANRALLEKEIKEYCKLNGINDVAGFITQCILMGFNTFRYGTSLQIISKGRMARLNPSQQIEREKKNRQRLKIKLRLKKGKLK